MPADHFADRLTQRSRELAPVCVGIDPVYERLPPELRSDDPVAALEQFSRGVLEAVRDQCACVKIQSACFERYGWRGVRAYEAVLTAAAGQGVLTIADAKRGDIGISAEHYAVGCLAHADALTISSYFGDDGVEPFVKAASAGGKGLFALVRTSNPGGDALQSLRLTAGGTVAEAVAKLIAKLGHAHVGSSGYSLLGAVVGATKAADAAQLRALMPRQIFLVPGFGAQGAGADDVKACFKPDGSGALVTASRSVIYAFTHAPGKWTDAVRRAAVEFRGQVSGLFQS